MEKRELGALGEKMAENWLLSRDYQILEKNWRTGRLELDMIALKNNVLVFIEVKTRSTETHDFPEAAVDFQKRKNMIAASSHYVESIQWNKSIRYDVISVVVLPHVKKITHFRDAFFPLGEI